MPVADTSGKPLPRAQWRGQLFVLSAPSGTGKTTITSRLQQAGLIKLSVSYTTRPPRSREKPGEHYIFISEDDFFKMRDGDEFLEWAQVYGHYYATSRQWVEAQLAAGENVLLEIDCQGARQVKDIEPRAQMIFVRPPDLNTLRRRLLGRRQDDEATVNRRMAVAEEEMAQEKYFDYVVVNDRLEDAIARVSAVISQPHEDISH